MYLTTPTLESINNIQKNIKSIVEKELENKYAEYEQTKVNNQHLSSTNNTLKKELDQEKRKAKHFENYMWRMKDVLIMLQSDWVIEIIEDWDCWYDEYWNWWWYRVEFVKYKDKQIEIDYEQF